MKQAILSLIFALLLLSGCKTTEIVRYVDRDVVVSRDSIVTRIVKDTVLIYPAQENNVVTVDSSYLKTDLAFSFAKIRPDGLLFHSIENFGKIPSKVFYNEIVVTNDKTTTVTIQTTKTVTKLRTDWIWWVGIGSMIFGIVFVAFKIKKFLYL